MGYYAAIALLSAATLLLEISLLRLFAVQQFYHFAFMAVSLALLGAGASGSALSLWPRRRAPALLCFWFSLTTIGSYLVINYLPFDSFRIAWESRQLLYLAIYFLAAAVPFFFAGLLVGGELLLAGGRGASHRVYGANLIGSAAGSLSSLIVLSVVGGVGTVLITAVVALAAGLLFLVKGLPGRSTDRILAAALAGLLLAGLWLVSQPPPLLAQRLSPYKTLSILSQTLNARHSYSAEDATARIDVIESETIHTMPGLSLATPVELPPQAGLILDGDNLQPITRLAPDAPEAAVLADHLPVGLAFRLRPNAAVLVLNAGTGADALWALAAGAQTVTAVEENEGILAAVRATDFGAAADLWADARVTFVPEGSRTFVRRPAGRPVDLVILSLTDNHRPVTSGAFSLTESHLYTVEAVEDYLGELQADGLLVVTRWLQTPPSESGRTFALLAEGLAKTGRDPHRHLLAYRTVRTVTILAGRQPFSQAEIDAARAFWQARGFDPIYFPGIHAEETNRFNVLPEPVYYELFLSILDDPEAAYQLNRFDIRPPTDNRPFFYHYFKWGQTPEILATLGLTWQPFGGSGYFVLVALLVVVGGAAGIFILGPLLVWRRQAQGAAIGVRWWRGRVFTYFAGLGLAFLFVEIPLAQRFILVLGQPVTALAAVISSLLLFSGLGSLTAPRWRLTWGLAALVILIAVYPWLLDPLSRLALTLPEAGRFLVTFFSLAPLGFLMGLPFAGGLRLVERLDPFLVPWAWAINGSFSVISAVLAVMIALAWGFSAVLWLGGAAYLLALVAFGTLQEKV